MSTAVTPEITINNTAAEIKAAMEAQAAAEVQPVESAPIETPSAPSSPEWGQMAENPDGTYQVTLATGEVFKGTAREVIAKQAEAQYNTKRWGLDWKQKAESSQPQQTDPSLAPPAIDPAIEAEQLRQYQRQLGLESLSAALGIPVEQVPQVLQQHEQAQLQWQINSTYMDFVTACPDYQETPENNAAMLDYLNAVPANGRFWSADDLRVAWARAVYDKKANPFVPPQPPAPVFRPPMMPTNGAASQANEPNPWTMPKDQLKKLAFGG